MYFKLGKEKVIKATISNGHYIVTHVVGGYKETAFAVTDINMPNAEEEAYVLKKPKQLELTKDQKEVYMLMHRRFNHLRPNKIRNLYKVTTFSKPIKVLTKR
jgi:hypothetical protein